MTTVPAPLATIPEYFRMAGAESYPLGFDTTNIGGPPESAVFELTNADGGAVIPLTDDYTAEGPVLTQVVRRNTLEEGTYFLTLTSTISDVKIALMVLTIKVLQ